MARYPACRIARYPALPANGRRVRPPEIKPGRHSASFPGVHRTGPRPPRLAGGHGAAWGFCPPGFALAVSVATQFVYHDTIENLALKYTEIGNRYETMAPVAQEGKK